MWKNTEKATPLYEVLRALYEASVRQSLPEGRKLEIGRVTPWLWNDSLVYSIYE